jgi:hypothetical protein
MQLKFSYGHLGTNHHGTQRKGEPWNNEMLRGWTMRICNLEIFRRLSTETEAIQSMAGRRLWIYAPSGKCWNFDVYLVSAIKQCGGQKVTEEKAPQHESLCMCWLCETRRSEKEAELRALYQFLDERRWWEKFKEKKWLVGDYRGSGYHFSEALHVYAAEKEAELRKEAWEAGRDAAAKLCEDAICPKLDTYNDVEKGWNEALTAAAGSIRNQKFEENHQ